MILEGKLVVWFFAKWFFAIAILVAIGLFLTGCLKLRVEPADEKKCGCFCEYGTIIVDTDDAGIGDTETDTKEDTR